eukprot:1151376-Pelagomonas_calceolata.AAC.3
MPEALESPMAKDANEGWRWGTKENCGVVPLHLEGQVDQHYEMGYQGRRWAVRTGDMGCEDKMGFKDKKSAVWAGGPAPGYRL